MNDESLTKEYLHEIFDYKDGNLYWKIKPSNRVNIGDKVGCLDRSTGYGRVRLKRALYGTHRLIFIMHHGYSPAIVDHIDCNPQNNRIENLREANQKTNQQNQKIHPTNTSGYKNVTWVADKKKWAVRMMIDGKTKHKGYFNDPKDAAEFATKVREELFGSFANHG
jgi:hypothetical protein